MISAKTMARIVTAYIGEEQLMSPCPAVEYYSGIRNTRGDRKRFEMTKNKEKKLANKRRRKLAKQRLMTTAEPEPKKFPWKEVNHLLWEIRSILHDAMLKEGFLWELVRRATRALALVRMESFVDKNKFGDPPLLLIHIAPDKTNNTSSIIDSGIGMTRDDLVSKLGTIDTVAVIDKYMKPLINIRNPMMTIVAERRQDSGRKKSLVTFFPWTS